MPPKAKKNEPSKKTEQKKKEKVIEDKTFGLKNKKGGKQQKFIKNVTQQVQFGNQSARKMELNKKDQLSEKEKKKQKMDELNMLFKPVEQKVGKGVDTKSVLCAFFKQGQCTKGDKCKFSHDLNIGRKAEKRSMYADEKSKDNMDDWDEAKLEEVVNKKHGEKNKAMPKTTIICKHFLEAVESSKYGWFWECPSGANCHYKHALPPGFELKKDKKAREERKVVVTLEELIEKERASLSSENLTRVTLESFLKWKEKKKAEKKAKYAAEQNKKKSNFKDGKMFGISGRDMFTFNPDLVAGDDEDGDDTVYMREEDDEITTDNGPVKEIDLATMASMAQEVDGSGTVAAEDRLKGTPTVNGIAPDDESTKLSEAAGGGEGVDEAIAGDDVIDENLFDGEDLDLIEDELETLELE